MSDLLEKFLGKHEFTSYEDFFENLQIHIPSDFNYAYNVVDVIASETPDKTAMVWCDDSGNEAKFTFAQMKYYSDKAANFFKGQGIKRVTRLCLSSSGDMSSGSAFLGCIKSALSAFGYAFANNKGYCVQM